MVRLAPKVHERENPMTATDELATLEADYPHTPALAQPAELKEINRPD